MPGLKKSKSNQTKFPDQPYFPFCLGNGIDSVLVDYSGSMHCDSGHLHLEQHEGAVPCWEKVTHRQRHRYLVPLAQFPYRLTGEDGELFEIGTFAQRFDPVRAVLTTEVEATILRLRIETFLTDDHLYVERYTVLATDTRRRPVLAFLARQPYVNLPGMTVNFPKDYRVSFEAQNDGLMTGRYAFDEIEGTLAVGVDADPKRTHAAEGQIQVRNLAGGDVVTRMIALVDNSHPSDGDAATVVRNGLSKGVENILAEHENRWREYHFRTRVRLPDAQVDQTYRTSLWLARASQNPRTGFITSGLYHAFKGGGYACYWDLIFAVRALLTANQFDAARGLLDFYQSTVGQARAYAAEIGRSGAYFPWFANHEGRSLDFDRASDRPAIQKWNNSCVTMELFDPFRFGGDPDDLRRRLPLIREILDFLFAEIAEERDGGYGIKSMQGSDENIDRRNDTSHLLTLIKGLAGYIEGCETLNEPVPDSFRQILAGLQKSLKSNFHGGVLYDFEGGLDPSSAIFTYQALAKPEGVGARGFRTAIKCSQSEWGLTNNGTYRNLIWPWTEGRAALAASAFDPKFGWQRIRHVVRFASTHGIFPEKVRPDGFWVLFGYLTAHTTFVYAVNSLLAGDDGKTLNVAVGLPKDWKELYFEKIFTPSGFAVSLDLQRGRIRRLIVDNRRDIARSIRLRVLNQRPKKVRLMPGENRIV